MLYFVVLVKKDMDINEPERLSNITLRHKLKAEDQLVLIKKGYGCK